RCGGCARSADRPDRRPGPDPSGSGPGHGAGCGSAAPVHTAGDRGGGRSPVTVLILGGTAEARALAAALDRRGAAFLSSLAGRVSRPRLPVGEVRIGGFGGPDGLAAFLTKRGVAAVVDATHPFAVGRR